MEPTPEKTSASPVQEEGGNILFRVTVFSKALAALLFIALPFVGFWIGIKYAASPVVVAVPFTPSVNWNVTPTPPSNVVSVDDFEVGATTTVVTAYITAVDEYSIELDYVDVFTDEEARKKMIEDGKCNSGGTITDCFPVTPPVYDRNISAGVRAFPLAQNVAMYSDRNIPLTLSDLRDRLAYFVPEEGVFRGALFEITINSRNEVTEVSGIFRP